MHSQTPGRAHRRGLADNARFLKNMIAAPRITGAVAPSGPALARAMAAAAGQAPRGLIVELGPGTGPVTHSLIERGIAPERIVSIEYDAGFAAMLGERFPGVNVVCGDAYDLASSLASFKAKPVAAFVSSLPLLVQPPERREKLIHDAFALMGRDGVFVQFTYGFFSPIPLEACAGRYTARRGRAIWRNLPPARVWTYRLEHRGEGTPHAA
jgi:phosphatidylethanolamine/phosphatidyl-N-methylethanolamine N-methyltransferase